MAAEGGVEAWFQRVGRRRLTLALVGAAAGLAFYMLGDLRDDGTIAPRLYLALAAFSASFFGGFLALTGPMAAGRAMLRALLVALPVTALVSAAGLRYDDPSRLFADPDMVLAALFVAALPLPFLIAADRGTGWRDYALLFTESWDIVVRYAASVLFTLVLWLAIWLALALFDMVGLEVIGRLIRERPVPWVITGAALGLSLAVVTELSDYISPFLALRLLRLLVPVAAVVVAVFLVALPFARHGVVTVIFGGAPLLNVMATLAVTLITVAVAQSNQEAVQAPALRLGVQALALMLPLLAGLALGSVWLNLADGGATPERLFAGAAALILFAYGLVYAGAVLLRRHWMARIRTGNTVLALGLIAVAALWMTPVLDTRAISARDQEARLLAGATSGDGASPRFFERLGRAGAAALVRLRAAATEPGREALAALLRPQPPQTEPADDALGAELARLMPVVPAGGEALRDEVFAQVPAYMLRDWLFACRRSVAGRPACVMVHGAFLPAWGEQALVVSVDGRNTVRLDAYGVPPGGELRRMSATVLPTLGAATGLDPRATFQGIFGGDGLGTPQLNALTLPDAQVVVLP